MGFSPGLPILHGQYNFIVLFDIGNAPGAHEFLNLFGRSVRNPEKWIRRLHNMAAVAPPPVPPYECKFLRPRDSSWRTFKYLPVHTQNINITDDQRSELARNTEALNEMLLQALQMPNLVILAGSGTSLGRVGGPSMWTLWDHVVHSNPDTGSAQRFYNAHAQEIIQLIGFNATDQNIEALLSRCEAWLQINGDPENKVQRFIDFAKATILERCTSFLSEEKLDAHRTFLHRLSRRRVSDPRVRLFTTNYDLCFEKAASMQGSVTIDGFSFTRPRVFDPTYFGLDVVRRGKDSNRSSDFFEGVLHVMKLHGSVNWERQADGAVIETDNPNPANACLIYPAHGKYQQSYIQPHLELMSRFLGSLREPDTCLMISGFGFNDDHLSAPIISAIQTNPNLKVIVSDLHAERFDGSDNPHHQELVNAARNGSDVWLIQAPFGELAYALPHLKTLTPAQQLEKAIGKVRGNQ